MPITRVSEDVGEVSNIDEEQKEEPKFIIKGENSLTLDNAQICIAIQYWLEREVLKLPINVSSIQPASRQNTDFNIRFVTKIGHGAVS